MRIDRSTRLQLIVHKHLFTVLLLVVIGMLAWLSQHYSFQADWTANQRNSLSSASVELLQTLQGPVRVNVYTREDATLQAAVQEIMERYSRIKADFSYRHINPDIDIVQAEQDRIERYGQVVIHYNGKRETIGNLSEQAISSALLRLARDGQRDIVFLAGHGERDPASSDNRGYSKLAAQLADKGLASRSVNLLQESIPDSTSVLVVAGVSKQLLAGELEQLRDYVGSGGNLLWLVDPGELYGMEVLADDLQVAFHPGMVVDNNIELRNTLRIEHPAIIPVLEYYPHPVSKGINYNALFPLARGVEPRGSSDTDWEYSTLWQSFEQSWSETGPLMEEIVFATDEGDIAGPVPLAVALEKIITEEAAGKATQRIVVVGDTDFMANAYIGVGANLDLATNLLNWLAGDDDLIAVEIRNARDLQLQLSDLQVLVIGTLFLVIVPLGLLAAGTLIWRRRKQR